MNKLKNKIIALFAIPSMLFTLMPAATIPVKAESKEVQLQGVKDIKKDDSEKNIVWVTFNDGTKGKITFLENNVFRYNVDPTGEFKPYADVRSGYPDTAKIQQYPDTSDEYTKPAASVSGKTITAGNITINFDENAKMTVKTGNKVVMEEQEALSFDGKKTVQTLVQHDKTNYSDIKENYFGGGTQNGRFLHTGKAINIANESSWNDGGVSSPNPFYYTTNGYGVLRNTYQNGKYDFGASTNGTVSAVHNENEFDAYYFVSDKDNGSEVSRELLQGYYKVTGNPTLLPEYGFYLGHLNAYNRDAWSNTGPGTNWEIKGNGSASEAGTSRYEQGGTGYEIKAGQTAETLNGTGPTLATQNVPDGVQYSEQFSARAIIDEYQSMDMPFGFFLPNDGYGAGYGQNGYKVTGGVNADGSSSAERLAAVAANVENLKEFTEYANSKGVAAGLWTQSRLTPDSNSNTFWHVLRDFNAEVKAGVTTLKTDVAWVGNGYSFQLSGVKQAHNIITGMKYDDGRNNTRPNIISLDGWAGSQRYNSVWTGDQTGGDWEYIRFHIPTFIGQSMSGNPNVGSDMDGIWGGKPLIATRDYQWKSFAPQMLDMDGWGKYMKSPYVHGDPYTGVSRMYLKLKAQMMPYTYTNAYAASNIDTKNGDQGLPMVRAMMLEYPEEELANSLASQYQYMWGGNLLVAPIYQDTDGDADKNNDIRNNIYLPDENEIWVDYFTGEQYRGGQLLNNFDAPLWKMPLFVKNGSIIPMYEEHNSADSKAENGVDKTKRIVEFWPAGESQFNTFEDDGSFIENEQDSSDKAYGSIDKVSYGNHVETLYTSKVDGTKATLTANKSTGTYEGYNKDKDTTFVVNVSKQPTSLKAFNGNKELTAVTVNNKADFDAATPEAGKVVKFYDANPEIETFASAAETNFNDMVDGVKISPKLYVKFANTDTQTNVQKLEIEGFENDGKLDKDQLNNSLAVPALTENEALKQPTSISLEWNKVDAATSYEILIDGKLFNVGDASTYKHDGLAYKSSHTYQIRSRNADGYSTWSTTKTFTSADDPFLNTPKPVSIDWTGKVWGSHSAALAFDHVFQTGDGGFHSNNGGINEKLTVDYGNAYLFDTIEYYPRTDVGNGTVTQMKVETSLDGVHWIQHGDKAKADGTKYYQLAADATMKDLNVSDENIEGGETIGARYIRFTALESVGTFFSASEIKPVTVPYGQVGSTNKPFSVGNIATLGTAEATETSYESMYAKESSAHSSYKNPNWRGEIQAVYGDINNNGYSDVYDYAFTAFKVAGGTKKKGSVTGAITLESDKTEIKAGETFTVSVTADNVKTLNAYGSIIHYDPAKVEYVSSDYTDKVSGMYTKGMTKAWVYDDGTAFVNHNAMNMGDKELVNGSGVLSTVTMKAKQDIVLNDVTEPSKNAEGNDFIIDLSTVTLVGPDYSFINSVKGSEVNDEIKYTIDDFNITMTNDLLPTDDGTNITKLIQQNNYEGLFNGSIGRDFEFKWDIPQNHVDGKLPEYIKVPLTMHLDLKDPSLVQKVVVANANKANGYLTGAKAKLIYTDGTKSDEITISEEKENYEFVFTPQKAVQRIDVTFSSTIDGKGNPVSNMLTLAELEITGKPYKEEIIEFGQDKFDITMTNELLPTDDGTNVNKLIQQNNYNGLFNGAIGREFEFKWDIPQNHVDGKLPEYITLPLTMNLKLKEAALIDKVVVANANKGNGYLKSAKAQLIYTDGTKSDEITIDEEKDKYEFVFTPAKNVASIDIVFVDATSTDSAKKNMLTLAELEITGRNAISEEVNKGVLQDSLTEARAIDTAAYTPASVAVLNKAITAGETVLNNPAATAEEVENAVSALAEAVAGLTKVAITAPLEEAIANAGNIDRTGYTSTSVEALEAAIVVANGVIADKNATQQQVDDALIALNNAINGLVVDKAGLEALVANAEGLDLTNKTETSVSALKAAIRNAKAVLLNDAATKDDLKTAMDALNAAIEGLVDEGSDPTVPTVPVDPSNPSDSIKPGNGSNTGDTTNVTALAGMLLIAGGVIVSVNRKKLKK